MITIAFYSIMNTLDALLNAFHNKASHLYYFMQLISFLWRYLEIPMQYHMVSLSNNAALLITLSGAPFSKTTAISATTSPALPFLSKTENKF